MQRLLADCQRALRDRQLLVQGEQVEVLARDVADERRHHRFAVVIAGKQVGPRGFGRAAQPPPHVHLERDQVESDHAKGAGLFHTLGQWNRPARGGAPADHSHAGLDGRKLVGAGDAGARH